MTTFIDCIVGRAGSGKTHVCYEEIAKKIESNPLGPALILIVPEHRTYVAERELLGYLKAKSDMRATVTGFRRLAWRVLRDRAGALLPGISKLGKRLLLKKILLRRGKELKVLGRAALQRRFTEPLESLFEEFRNYNVLSAELSKISEEMKEDAIFSGKLAEIALLYEDYLSETQGKYQDTDDRMQELAKAISVSPLFDSAEIWIDGFLFFNPNERMVLRALFCRVKAVHITLPLDRDIPFREGAETSYLFFRAAGTLQKLKETAAELMTPLNVRVLHGNRRAKADGLLKVEQELFDYGAHEAAECSAVRIVEAATRRLEAEAAVADIVKTCRERGWRWNDFGILLRDAEHYQKIVEEMLADYDVPFYTDRKRAAVHHPLAELVRSALETVMKGWRYESVFRCVKTGMLALTTDEADELENHVLACGVRGEKAWASAWTRRRRRSGESEVQAAEILERINREREIVYIPLHDFAQALASAEDVRDYARAVYTLLEHLGIRRLLTAWAADSEKAGALGEAEEHRRIWASVMDLLDEFVAISGDESMTAEEFSDILCDGLDTLEIALVPPGNDAVTVASFDQNSLDNSKAIYILGANEGIMPRRSAEKGILTEADRMRMETAVPGRIELSPSRTQESANETYLLYHGFSEASSYLWVSWALSDSEGSGIGRSSVVRRLQSLVKNPVDMIPIEGAPLRDEFRFTQPKRAVGQLASALRLYLAGETDDADWTSVYNWALVHEPEKLAVLSRGALSRAKDESLPPNLAARLYTSNCRMDGSVSQFESFAQCPFRFFAQYGLRLAEREEYGFRAPEYGTLMHAVMYRFGDLMRREKRDWGSVSPEEQAAICRRLLEEEAVMVNHEVLHSTEQYKNLMNRMEMTVRESIARAVEFSKFSSFRPAMLEKSFGHGTREGSLLEYSMSNGMTLDIKGKIDRIDVGEMKDQATGNIVPYYLVIDYKTGAQELSMLDVYAGLRLQLLTYVMAAEQILAAQHQVGKPAGLFYCYLKNPVVRMKGKGDLVTALRELSEKLRFNGWVLDIPELVQAIDGTGSYLCVKLKPGPVISAGKKCAKSADEIQLLMAYTEECLKETAEAILRGEIRIRPFRHKKDHACQYCPYIAVCGFDVKIGSRERIIEDMKDEEILRKMLEKTGKETLGDEG